MRTSSIHGKHGTVGMMIHTNRMRNTKFNTDVPDEYAQFDTDVPEQDTHTTNEDDAASKISRNLRNLVCNKYIFRGHVKGTVTKHSCCGGTIVRTVLEVYWHKEY